MKQTKNCLDVILLFDVFVTYARSAFRAWLCSASIVVDGPSSTKKDRHAKHTASGVSDDDKRLPCSSNAE